MSTPRRAALATGDCVADGNDRHVPLEGQPNFRDLGGYETAEGRTVRWGHVFRSGELNRLTEPDRTLLAGLGLRTVVDLRSQLEIESIGEDRLPVGARGVALPIDPGNLASALQGPLEEGDFSKIPPDFLGEANRAIVREAGPQYTALLEAIAKPTDRPLVFHCTHGKDRAGMGSVILLLALDVPMETVRADYLLSNTYRAEQNRKELDFICAAIAEQKGVAEDEVDLTNLEALFYLDDTYFDAALDEMVRLHGSVDGYLRRGLGLTDAKRDSLRTALLE